MFCDGQITTACQNTQSASQPGRMRVTLSAGCDYLARKVEQQTHPGPVSEKRLNKLRLWTLSWCIPRWKTLQSLNSWSEALALTLSRFTLICTSAPRLQNINGGPGFNTGHGEKNEWKKCLLAARAKGLSSKYFPFFEIKSDCSLFDCYLAILH